MCFVSLRKAAQTYIYLIWFQVFIVCFLLLCWFVTIYCYMNVWNEW